MRLHKQQILVITLALLIPIIPFVVIGELPGEQWLSATDDNAFYFGLTGAGLLASDILLPIPSSIVGTMLGARLGIVPGWLWCWIGLMLGNTFGWLAGRMLFSRPDRELPEAPTLVILAISRPVPVLAEAVAFAAGAGGMSLRHFFLVTLIANGVISLVLAGNGATLLPDSFLGPGLLIPLGLPVVTWLVWRRYRKRSGNSRNGAHGTPYRE
ncbi:MAG: VTT domain-containing protein [gamma proteobacterium endosymbiont of Lamellibrachia anaximandri]|nr:VTT domain-containing protein [gamma proteobacterium endosymbiont of Lamellibrachia anaximandri]MBL3535576.1 VTT domain-containing protein [gamma proteobacterium endosymbiont of Lamellibrachia anaximandri]